MTYQVIAVKPSDLSKTVSHACTSYQAAAKLRDFLAAKGYAVRVKVAQR